MPHVIVYDSNREALQRRVAAVRDDDPSAEVTGVASRTAVLVLAELAPRGTVVLVDLLATDRFSLDCPGERLIRRLVRGPRTAHAEVYAWSAHLLSEVVRGVRSAGAAGFVSASLDPTIERTALSAALGGASVWPEEDDGGERPGVPTEPWEAWFEDRFGLPWAPWVEPILVRLAAGEDRVAAAFDLVELDAAKSRSHAAERMRVVSRAIAGEHSNSPPTVARLASNVLSHVASQRPLTERPAVSVSLEQGARAIRTSPSIVAAAGLAPDEIEELLAIDALIERKRAATAPSAGAPPADRVRSERHWAAGRRALELGADRADVDHVIAGILTRVDDALIALDDARQDELYHPEALAAAALLLVDPSEIGRIDGATNDDGIVRWRGQDARSLIQDERTEVKDLRALCAAVDEVVLARPATLGR